MRWATRAAPQGRYPRDIIRPYERFYRQRTGGGIFAHDASVVACAPDGSRFQVRRGALRVVTDGPAMGQTMLSPQGRQQACVWVDAAGVLADFRACVVR